MEYQKIMSLLDNAPNQPSEFRKKNWIEINGHLHGTTPIAKLNLKL